MTTRDNEAGPGDERRFEGVFRREAWQHHVAQGREGTPLRRLPAWTRWTYLLLVAAAVCGAAFVACVRVHDYAVGVAFVRFAGRTDVTARSVATVAAVDVAAGQRVHAGEVVATLVDDDGHERPLRAPRDGVVADVRVRRSQRVAPGDLVLSLAGDDHDAEVVTLVPGSLRPMLRPGMPLLFELDGYRYVHRNLVIEEVGDVVVGPAEARRLLGPDVGDAATVTGPVVVVRARIGERRFVAQGQAFDAYDGMRGVAVVRLGGEPLLLALLPSLRMVWPS